MKIIVVLLLIILLLLIGYGQGYVGEALMEIEFNTDSVTEMK